MTHDEREDLIDAIVTAVREGMVPAQLSPDETQWVRMAIAREAQRADMRRAVMTKTLTALLWAGLLFLAAAAWDRVVHMIADAVNNQPPRIK